MPPLPQKPHEGALEIPVCPPGFAVAVASQIAGRAAEEQLAVGQHEHACRIPLGLADVVGREDDAGAGLRAGDDELPQPLALAGIDVATAPEAGIPPELELGPEDLAWVATDLLALACDDEYPDPDDLAVSFREAVPLGQETELFEAMARGVHPEAEDVLNHLGKYHPDKNVAKAARTAAHKAASRRT